MLPRFSRFDYMSNTWNPHLTILYQYVTENVIDVIDTGGCCGQRKTLFPGRRHRQSPRDAVPGTP